MEPSQSAECRHLNQTSRRRTLLRQSREAVDQDLKIGRDTHLRIELFVAQEGD
jgi:hypothetical protein